MAPRSYWSVLKAAGAAWVDDRASSMGAALSYYTVFSLAPLLLIVVSVAGLIFGREAVEGHLVAQLGGLTGEQGAHLLQGLLSSVSKPMEGALGTVAGVALLLVGATTVFAELQDDLNRIWKVPARALPTGLWGMARARLLSFGLILAIGFLLLASLVASAAIAALGAWSTSWISDLEWLAHAVNAVVSFCIVTALFALIYRFMPQIHIRWHDVWVGAAVTALLFTLGKLLIGLYIGKSAVASGFGAAGSLAVMLVWLYYSAQIFLLGAEFTAAYASMYGSRRKDAGDGAAATAQSPRPGVGVAANAGRPPQQQRPAGSSAGAA